MLFTVELAFSPQPGCANFGKFLYPLALLLSRGVPRKRITVLGLTPIFLHNVHDNTPNRTTRARIEVTRCHHGSAMAPSRQPKLSQATAGLFSFRAASKRAEGRILRAAALAQKGAARTTIPLGEKADEPSSHLCPREHRRPRPRSRDQLAQLRAWSAAAGHTIASEYIDHVSGGKGADERPQLARMLDDAHRRKSDVLLCWSFDRLSREGLEPPIGYLRRLGNAGVAFHSYSEPMLSTDNPVLRDVLLAVMASMERARISERTRAGLERVKANGVVLGRRPLAAERQADMAALAREGLTAYAIGKRLGLDIKTVQKYSQAAEACS